MTVVPNTHSPAVIVSTLLFFLILLPIFYALRRKKKASRQKYLMPRESLSEAELNELEKNIERNPTKFTVRQMAIHRDPAKVATSIDEYFDSVINANSDLCNKKARPAVIVKTMIAMGLCKTKGHNFPPGSHESILHQKIQDLFELRYNTVEGQKRILQWKFANRDTADSVWFVFKNSTLLPVPISAGENADPSLRERQETTPAYRTNHVRVSTSIDRNGNRIPVM